jgi:dihydroorotase
MYDMEGSGAVAFSDGYNPVQSSGVLLKALQYLKAVDKTIIQMPDDRSISPHGLMNEGIVSTRLGLPGKPAIAEEMMIARDLELIRYTGSRLHLTGVSTAEGLHLIRKAKGEGLAVTCSVTPHHLHFVDTDLAGYDTNLKVLPPLRKTEDKESLIAAILDGTVDCIASHHAPHDGDSKVVEFEYAKNGMISLQTAFAVVRTAVPAVDATRLVALFSTNATAIFGLPQKSVAVGAQASLTLFSMEREWSLATESNHSRSGNSPFFGTPLKGKALGIINKDKLFLNQL